MLAADRPSPLIGHSCLAVVSCVCFPIICAVAWRPAAPRTARFAALQRVSEGSWELTLRMDARAAKVVILSCSRSAFLTWRVGPRGCGCCVMLRLALCSTQAGHECTSDTGVVFAECKKHEIPFKKTLRSHAGREQALQVPDVNCHPTHKLLS